MPGIGILCISEIYSYEDYSRGLIIYKIQFDVDMSFKSVFSMKKL